MYSSWAFVGGWDAVLVLSCVILHHILGMTMSMQLVHLRKLSEAISLL